MYYRVFNETGICDSQIIEDCCVKYTIMEIGDDLTRMFFSKMTDNTERNAQCLP
jgi:hypothetical protein